MSITRRSFISLFATLALAFSLFGIAPTAYADGEATSGTISATPATAAVVIGETLDMSNGQFQITGADGTYHIDYKITNTNTDTGAATINKHSGILTPSAAGTVTVTAYLTPGGTQQIQSNPCTTQLDLATKQVTITEPEELDYGYQGNALQILMSSSLDPEVVSYDSTNDVYTNSLSQVSASGGYYSFDYTQNYGIGNRTISAYQDMNRNDDEDEGDVYSNIALLNSSGASVADLNSGITLSQQGNSKTNLTVNVASSLLSSGSTYTLVFYPDYVAGNGSSTIGATVNFTFTA